MAGRSAASVQEGEREMRIRLPLGKLAVWSSVRNLGFQVGWHLPGSV